MRKKIIVCTMVVFLGLVVEGLAIYILASPEPFVGPFKNEPAAHALYEKMIESMRQAESLSFTSNCSRPGGRIGTYMIWMKKPNSFRVETISRRGIKCGTLVGDGDHLWIYWPGDRPRYHDEDWESYEKTCSNVYIKKATGIGKHSIGHELVRLDAGLGMAIVDPSTFHGYTDSLQPYLDGARFKGTDKVDDQECDVIEVSFMKRQRFWYLWLSKQDHLPRKLKQIIRFGRGDGIGIEDWSQVTINAEIPDEKFAWSPPVGWRQWFQPDIEDDLLPLGEEAPDFELRAADGGKIKLSDYRGKVVWFYIWRAG
jgi:outer membrane lipoprotein-sorting protein